MSGRNALKFVKTPFIIDLVEGPRNTFVKEAIRIGISSKYVPEFFNLYVQRVIRGVDHVCSIEQCRNQPFLLDVRQERIEVCCTGSKDSKQFELGYIYCFA